MAGGGWGAGGGHGASSNNHTLNNIQKKAHTKADKNSDLTPTIANNEQVREKKRNSR